MYVIITLSMTVLGGGMCGSLDGAHRTPRGFIVIPYVIALALTGLIFTWLAPPGFYGLHFVFHHNVGVAW